MKKVVILVSVILAVVSCGKKTAKLFPAEDFEGTVGGQAVALYTLKAGDIAMQVTNFGARVVSLYTPDRKGNMADIVCGHATLDEYVNPVGERFLGACVGPVANRIANARFYVNDTLYQIRANDNKVNTLHGGLLGLDNVVWTVKESTPSSITLTYLRPDGQEGYPGNLDIEMKYSLTEDNSFRVDYKAVTDKATPVNMSNHPFFNLRGEGTEQILDYVMTVDADRIVAIDEMSIPTGELMDVTGTPFDFREPHTIGERIDMRDNEQIKNGNGYDHSWCLTGKEPVHEACSVWDPKSGRCVTVLTDQPAIQIYSGNFFDGKTTGKYGEPLNFRTSIALETQHYPDSVNQPSFPSIILNPGDTYTQVCIYKFSVKEK